MAMDLLLLALTIGLPLIKILLFPARTMGRGGGWTLIGAVMIVGLMMVLWFGVQQLTATTSDAPAQPGAASDTSAGQLPDLNALAKLL